jgi:hypothetical protein
MNTNLSTVNSIRSGDRAIPLQESFIPHHDRTRHLTFILALVAISLAQAWGLYESVQLLTGVIPKF